VSHRAYCDQVSSKKTLEAAESVQSPKAQKIMRIKRASIPIFQNEYKVERREEAKAKPIQDRSDPEYIGQRHQRIQDYVKNQIHFDQLKKKRQRDLSKISLEDYL
jgi:hypothetical protein